MPGMAHDLGRIAAAGTRRDLWRTILDILHARGVTKVSFHPIGHDESGVNVMADGFPEHWVETYLEQEFVKLDPIPKLAAQMARPFYWHQIRDLAPVSDATDAFLTALEAAGIGDGLAFYVFGPGLQNAYVGLGFDSEFIVLEPAEVFEFQCLAQAAHLRYCALNEERGHPQPTLSHREREVLEWVARGKSNSVIADILEMSPHTVDAHMRKIYRKLEVRDRTTAALRGIGHGLLQYPA